MTGLLRDTMEEWSSEAQVPHDLADRALRRPTRRPVMAIAGVAALLAVAATVTGLMRLDKPAEGPTTTVTNSEVLIDTENNPPKKLVAAGAMAVSAYVVPTTEKLEGKLERRRWTWSLFNPVSQGYEQTPWAWVDVAPGMQRAAVLEGDDLGKRLGILDMNTQQITSWIDLDHEAGSVKWSPDGTKLLLTTYDGYPDRWEITGENSLTMIPVKRTGYYIVEAETGQAAYRALPASDAAGGPASSREDLRWSFDGSLIAAPTQMRDSPWIYYSFDGVARTLVLGQVGEPELTRDGISRVSPDGRLLLGESGLPTKITDRQTGAVVGSQQVLDLLAWADNEHVIAWGCVGTCGNEFNNGLVLVSVDGKETTQLSAMREDSTKDGTWLPFLTRR